ncbi:MAG: hypothetical protein AVDCRST_MAG54-2007, partial [uncultured Actinomycetospora sp.]
RTTPRAVVAPAEPVVPPAQDVAPQRVAETQPQPPVEPNGGAADDDAADT